MRKVIFVDPKGDQKLIVLGNGGRLSSELAVLWDERFDGPLDLADEAKVGGLTREANGTLSFNQVTKDAQDARIAAESATEAAKSQAATDALAYLSGLDTSGTLTPDEIRLAIKHLIELNVG